MHLTVDLAVLVATAIVQKLRYIVVVLVGTAVAVIAQKVGKPEEYGPTRRRFDSVVSHVVVRTVTADVARVPAVVVQYGWNEVWD